MLDGLLLGFDFGYKRIGVAVGHRLTGSASPLQTLNAEQGVPNWSLILTLINTWSPQGLVVGLPTCIDGREQYTTQASRDFAQQLQQRFQLPVYLVDERLTTVEARARLFEKGGYRKMQKSAVDSMAACLILEQWLMDPTDALE